jgi:hypothetical protein
MVVRPDVTEISFESKPTVTGLHAAAYRISGSVVLGD